MVKPDVNNVKEWPSKERRISIDWRIPIGALVFVVFQTMTLIAVGSAWKSTTDSRLTTVEKNMDALIVYTQNNDVNREKSNLSTARLEERFTSMDGKLGDILDELRDIKKGK